MNKLFLSLVLLGAVQIPPSPPQVPPRDAARDTPAKTGTAVIRGRITDRETGEPIARARVTLMRQGVERGDGPVQVRTGPDGRYEIRNLPAGEYSLVFEPGDFRATHLRQTFGETRPLDLSRPGMPRPFSLGDAEVKEASAALWRAFAIEVGSWTSPESQWPAWRCSHRAVTAHSVCGRWVRIRRSRTTAACSECSA